MPLLGAFWLAISFWRVIKRVWVWRFLVDEKAAEFLRILHDNCKFDVFLSVLHKCQKDKQCSLVTENLTDVTVSAANWTEFRQLWARWNEDTAEQMWFCFKTQNVTLNVKKCLQTNF